jgi:hypothetical protein
MITLQRIGSEIPLERAFETLPIKNEEITFKLKNFY